MIKVRLNQVMAYSDVSLKELALETGVSMVNLSRLKNGRVNSIRFSTLDKICEFLGCQPKDILEYEYDIDSFNESGK